MERIYEEIAAIAPAKPDGWLLPKVSDEWEIVKVNQSLFAAEAGLKLKAGSFPLHVMVESAAGVVNLREISRAATRLQSLVFGAEDYAASIGAVRSNEGAEIQFARSAIVAHAAAQGLHAVDCVYVHYQDAEGFAGECALARGLGFGGKTLIHPAQIAPCNEHFLPADKEIAWAQNVIASFEAQQDQGAGAFGLNGTMIDRPIYRIAQQVLARAAVG
jgi:citrate lyase subunit beta/citryl-CoA lyase